MGTVADKYKGSRAYKFDGLNDRINLGDILDETVWTSGKWTISEWVYPQHSTFNILLSKYINGQQQQFITAARDVGSGLRANMVAYGHLSSQVWRGFEGDTPLSLNEWYHLCFEYDSSKTADNQVRIFVNGIKQNLNIWASRGTVVNIQNGSESLLVNGLVNFNPTFTNPYRFDDVRVYGRHLTPTEITHLASKRGVLGSPHYSPIKLKSRITKLVSDRDDSIKPNLLSINKPKRSEPSYKSGYAKSASESASPHLWDGLVGAWMPSLGVTGNSLRDVSGNGNHGTLTNMDAATDWVATSKGVALDFDRTTNYVTTTFRTNYGNTFGYSVWYKSSSTANQNLIGSYQAGRSTFALDINLTQATNSPAVGFISCFAQFGTSRHRFSNTSALSLSDGKWHHISAFVRSGSYASLFFDGKQVPIAVYQANSGSFREPALDIWLGAPNINGSTNGAGLLGSLGHAAVYDRILSPQEIQELYVDSLAPFRQKSIRIFGGVGIPTDTSKIITVKRNKSDVEPSYKSGYAQSAGESAHPNLWDGLVGAWMPSMGVTGKTLRDVSGNENHGTLTNMDPATDWVTSEKGSALDFDGNNDFVTQADPQGSFARSGSDDLTVSCWVYPKRYNQYQSIIGNRNAHLSFNWLIYQHANGGDIQLHGSSQYRSGYVPAASKWTHICATVNSNTCRLFANGNLVQGPFYYTYWNANPTQLTFGAYGTPSSYGEPFLGGLSNISIYHRALTPDEIQTLYVDSLAPFRKKQQVAFNAYPLTLLEKIRSAAKPTTPVSVRVKHNEEPSYKAGYAKSASESANPKLWDGLVSAFVPSFGVTGETLHDLTASNNDGIIYHQNRTINEVWTKTKVGPAVSTYPSGGFQGITTPANNLSMDEFTIVANVRFENRYPGTYPCITVKENNYLDRNWFLGMFPDEEIAFVRSMSGDRWVKSGVVPNKTDFYSIAATSSKVLSHAIYVNGELKNSAHYTGTRSVAGNQNYIGIYKGNINYPLGGSISCILYYSRILSPSEIKHLYADPLAPFRRKAKPIGYQPNKELRGLFRT
jgi:hypothetical protein